MCLSIIVPDEHSSAPIEAELRRLGWIDGLYPVSAIGFDRLPAYAWSQPRDGWVTSTHICRLAIEYAIDHVERDDAALSVRLSIPYTSSESHPTVKAGINSFLFAQSYTGRDTEKLIATAALSIGAKDVWYAQPDTGDELFRPTRLGLVIAESRLMEFGHGSFAARVNENVRQTYVLHMVCNFQQGQEALARLRNSPGIINAVGLIARKD